jgi:carbonic anhydrase/acetyltransferase-like protein (isoleucine patch superfamily)
MPIRALGDLAPTLPKGRHFIAPDAFIVGNVILEDEVSIWFGAVLRAEYEHIRIGARSNVQDGTVMHVDPGFPLTLGKDVSVGHNAIVHGCTVGDGTINGMGATVLNGAVIGENSLVGANALVTGGMKFPPRSLILGAPAKLVRELSDAEVADTLATADGYVKLIDKYRAAFPG